MSGKKKDGFSDLAAAFAKVYSTENAAEVFDGSYDDQVRNPAFIGMLLYNCMVMNALYGCRRGGCAGCRARDLFDRVESKFIEKRDELFNEVKSRRELEQTYFKFMASEGKGKPGHPKGTGAGTVEYKKKSTMECAVEAVWPTVQHLLKHRGEMFTAYKILPDEKLIEMRQTLVEHEQAIASVLKTRAE